MSEPELRNVFSEKTVEGGVLRLSVWPEGYVLWLNGEIVWREWEVKQAPISPPSGFACRFAFGDKVVIDGDASIRATVIGFAFYPHGAQVQCAWFANGSAVESWLGEFRLSHLDAGRAA